MCAHSSLLGKWRCLSAWGEGSRGVASAGERMRRLDSVHGSHVRVHGARPRPRGSEHRGNILMLGFPGSACLSVLAPSGACGSVPSPLRLSWSVARHPSPPHPRLEGRFISGVGRYPEMRSLSLQVMGNCHPGLPSRAKQKLTLPLLLRFLLEGPPPFSPLPHSPSAPPPAPGGGPPRRPLSPWESVRPLLPLLLPPPEKPALAPGLG